MFTWIVMPILVVLLLSVLIAALVLPVLAFRKWDGAARWLALAPVVIIVLVMLRFALDWRRGLTAHNLWPLALLVWDCGGLAFLGLIWMVRQASKPSPPGGNSPP